MDEHDDSCPVATASQPAENVALPRDDKTLVGNLSREGQIEGSFGGNDGEEIMVEVVGSDVLVDGVGGHGDGEAGSDGCGKECLDHGIEMSQDGGGGEGDLVGQQLRNLGQLWNGASQTEIKCSQDTADGLSDSVSEQAPDSVSEGVELDGSSGVQTPAVSGEVVVKIIEVGIDDKSIEHGEQTNMQFVDRVDGRIGELSIKEASVCSSSVEESLSTNTQVTAEGPPEIVGGEGSACTDILPDGNVVGVNLISVETDESSEVEVTERNNFGGANAEYSDQRIEVALQKKVDVTEEGKVLDSEVDDMEIDAYDQKLHSDEYQDMEVQTNNEHAVNHSNLDAASLSLNELTSNVDGGQLAAVGSVSANSVIEAPKCVSVDDADVQDVHAYVATSVDQTQETVCYSGSVRINALASDSETHLSGGSLACTSRNTIIATSNANINYSEDEKQMAKSSDGSPKTYLAVCAESESSSLANQIANSNKGMALDGKISNPQLGVPTVNDKDEFVHCSDNFQSMKCETGYDSGGKVGVMYTEQEKASFVEEETVGVMEIKELSSLKDETPGIGALEGSPSHSEKDQDLKVENADECSENNVAQEHEELNGKAVQVSGIDAPDLDSEQLTSGMMDDLKLYSSSRKLHASEVDENVKAAASGRHVLVGCKQILAMNDQKKPETEVESLNGLTYSQNNQEVKVLGRENTKTEGVVLAEAESSCEQTENGVRVELLISDCEKAVEAPVCIELAGGSIGKDIVDNDPSLTAQIVDHRTSDTQIKSDTLGGRTNEVKKEETIAQLDEMLTQEVARDQGVKPRNVTEVSNKGVSVADLPDSIGEAGGGSQSAFNTASSHCEDEEQTRGNYVPDMVTPCEIANSGIGGTDEAGNADDQQARDTHVQEDKASNIGQEVEVEDPDLDREQFDLHMLEMEIDEHITETDQLETNLNPVSYDGLCYSNYLLPPQKEDEYSVSDLVWGKVRSHPWWPGQIFDPADASEKAITYHKEGCYLVAYFGDHTFAWNDASMLKPFRSHFFEIEKQSNSEVFHNAVNSALEEVSRRVELGLACPCIPKDEYKKMEAQIIENTGICQESSKRYGENDSTGPFYFEPCKLMEYIRVLSLSPSITNNRLELVIAKAQLLAFCRFKSYRYPPEFQFCGDLAEIEADTSELSELDEHHTPALEDSQPILVKNEDDPSHKRKHSSMDDTYLGKKEGSVSELMAGMPYSPDGEDMEVLNKSSSSSFSNKRMAADFPTDGSDRRTNFHAAKVSTTASSSPKPSFKVGECIRRVASQLTGSSSIIKNYHDTDVSRQTLDGSQRGGIPTEYLSLEQILLQLHLAAQDPEKGYSFLSNITDFFLAFRNSIILSQHSVRQNSSLGTPGSGRKRKGSQAPIASSEDFEFDDANDSYWTDRIIQNYSEQQLLQNSENGEEEYHINKPPKQTRRTHSRKRYSTGNYEMAADGSAGYIDEKLRDSSPTELILSFPEAGCVPSEMNLNKIFRRFGPLMESETEVDREAGRARVVFKRGCDAKVAFSSAGKFNIFGSMVVSYQINFSPTVAYKVLPLAITQSGEEATLEN